MEPQQLGCWTKLIALTATKAQTIWSLSSEAVGPNRFPRSATTEHAFSIIPIEVLRQRSRPSPGGYIRGLRAQALQSCPWLADVYAVLMRGGAVEYTVTV